MRRLRSLLVALGLAATLGVVAAEQASPVPSGAKALEATLLSPCCFGGTIDVHDSDVSRALRLEIESRVAAGEPTASIEDDLVHRYGTQIRAMPDARVLLGLTVAVVLFAVAAGGVLVRFMLRRRSPGPEAPPASYRSERDAYDDRLDAELEAFE